MPTIKRPLVYIFITVLIDCIGMRIISPISASIIAEVCKVEINEAIQYNGWLLAIYGIMQFIFSPLLGALSDQLGRKPVLLLSLFGLGLNYIFLALSSSLSMLFIGRIIAGVCGASLTTAFAYVTDVSLPEKRAQNFGMIGSAIGLGFIIGPLIGGFFSAFGTRVPFYIAAGLSLLNFIYGIVILPESLKQNNRRKFNFKRTNPFNVFFQLKNNHTNRNLLLSLFLIYLAGQSLPAIWPFYTKYLFHWSDLQIGYSLAFVGLMVAVVKGKMIYFSQREFGLVKSVCLGLFFTFLGLVLFSCATQAWMLYVIIVIYCLGGIVPPIMQDLISQKTADNEQGETQGIITSLLNVSNIISPLAMAHLFHVSTTEKYTIHYPGMPFMLSALIIVLSIIFFYKAIAPNKKLNNLIFKNSTKSYNL